MAKSIFNFHSEILGFHTTVHILFPEPHDCGVLDNGPFDEELPVLYLLHGLRGGAHTWTAYTSLERYMHESHKKLIIVMPEMGNDFYTDQKIGWKYLTYMTEELPRIMQTFMRISPKRENTYVAGLSMGGYGAMKMALTCPDQYAYVASFSGVLDMEASVLKACADQTGPDVPLTKSTRDAKELARISEFIFGGADDIPGSENDLFHLLETTAKRNGPKPKMYISCGTADGLFSGNARFFERAQAQGYDVKFHEEANEGHCWRFWDKEVEKLLRVLL